VMVAWSAFINYTDTDLGRNDVLAPLTQTLISSFTALTGVVVGAYFSIEAIKLWRSDGAPRHLPNPELPAMNRPPHHQINQMPVLPPPTDVLTWSARHPWASR
jgi:hypothetical protein